MKTRGHFFVAALGAFFLITYYLSQSETQSSYVFSRPELTSHNPPFPQTDRPSRPPSRPCTVARERGAELVEAREGNKQLEEYKHQCLQYAVSPPPPNDYDSSPVLKEVRSGEE